MIHKLNEGQKYRFGLNLGPRYLRAVDIGPTPRKWWALYFPPLLTVRWSKWFGLEGIWHARR